MDTIDDLGVFVEPTDFTYNIYTAQIYVEWNPNIHRLRKLGFFAENESPMVARFASTAVDVDESGVDVKVEIVPKSYVQIPIQFIPDQLDTNEFELVDTKITGVHDAVAVKLWQLVPRRVKP
jgi:hypothetical protein